MTELDLTPEQALRFKCLQLAIELRPTEDKLIVVAKRFESYLTGRDVAAAERALADNGITLSPGPDVGDISFGRPLPQLSEHPARA